MENIIVGKNGKLYLIDFEFAEEKNVSTNDALEDFEPAYYMWYSGLTGCLEKESLGYIPEYYTCPEFLREYCNRDKFFEFVYQVYPEIRP